MKNLNQLSRKCFAYAIIFSLLQTSVYAQQSKPAVNPNIQAAATAASAFINTVGNVMLSQKEAQRKAAAQAQAERLRVSLSPACQANGKSCYTVQSKYFPQCPIPASMANMPQNVCSVSMDDTQRVNNQAYAMLGGDWINYYNQMMNEASNMSVPFGLKCLQDQQKKLDSQMTEMVNNLTRLQDQLNRDKEVFKANQEKLLSDLDSNYDELMGDAGSGGNNLDLKSKNFFANFPVNCQGILGEKFLGAGSRLGLMGLRKTFEAPASKASLYSSNRPAIKSEIERDIANFQRAIKAGGVEDFIQGNRTDDSKYASVKEALVKQSKDYVIAKTRIATELQKYGESLPSGSKTIDNDFDEYIKRFQDREKRKYVNDCVTGADKSGVAIPLASVLGSLKQKSTGSAGNATTRYRATIEQIMKSDISMEDKLKKIESFEKENKYIDMSVEYTNSSGQKIIETPYNLYMKTLAACEKRFTSTGDSIDNVVSQKKKLERGKALLQEFKALHDSFSSNLSNTIQEKIFSCNGEAKQAGESCTIDKSSGVFDATASGFCMNHADQCANEMAGCMSVAAKQVQDKETKIKSLANAFNVSSKSVIDRSNLLFEQQKNASMALIKQLQQQFPGTNFQIPTDMSISLPGMKKDKYGVDVYNNGNLNFLDEFPKKIDLLKKLFTDQQKVLNNEIQDYIGKQVSAMEREKGRWEAFTQTCKGAHEASEKQVQDYNNAGMEKQAKEDDKVASFCRKYYQARENPLEACDEAKSLAQDADKIAARLTNSALSYTMNFKNVCNSVNNEKDSLSSCDGWDDPKEDMTKVQRRNCKAQVERETRRLEAQGGVGKVGKKVTLPQLCTDDTVTDAKFLENLSKHIKSPGDKEILKEVKSIKDLKTKASESSSLSDFYNSFVRGIEAYASDKASSVAPGATAPAPKPICASALEIEDTDLGALEDVSTEKRSSLLEKAQEMAEKAKTSISKKQEELKTEKDPAKIAKLEKEIKDEQAELAKGQKDIEKVKASRYKAKIKAGLLAISEQDKDKMEIAEMKLSDLGEQAENSCDSQANRMLGKNLGMPGSILPAGFDNAILGK